jgi:hypothetical protein
MCGKLLILLTLLTASLAGSGALAAQLKMPADAHEPYEAYTTVQMGEPWSTRPRLTLIERPIGDVLAARLGVAEGSAQLFQFRLENAPSRSTMLKGFVDGGGIKLKLSW